MKKKLYKIFLGFFAISHFQASDKTLLQFCSRLKTQSTMLLRRLGNKASLAHLLVPHFPQHEIFFDVFFGAGGLFFNKPFAKYNYVNDIDSNIFNLFQVLEFRHEELAAKLIAIPYDKTTFKWIRKQHFTCPIWKAAQFCVLSNYGFLGKPNTLKIGAENNKGLLIENLYETKKVLDNLSYQGTTFQSTCSDYKEFIKCFRVRGNEVSKTFAYCDKPYTDTTNNYGQKGKKTKWTANDDIDFYDTITSWGGKAAISEYKTAHTIEIAKAYNLNLIEIKERHNLNAAKADRKTEILLTNYKLTNTLFQ